MSALDSTRRAALSWRRHCRARVGQAPSGGVKRRRQGLHVPRREWISDRRIERTLFILDWLQSVELRRRACRLNKRAARNSLARAVFFRRLGEFRDRSFEQQRYRVSGLYLLIAAIVLWNTVYLDRATRALARDGSRHADPNLLQYLSPLDWEHINLTGDYLWRSSSQLGAASSGRREPLGYIFSVL